MTSEETRKKNEENYQIFKNAQYVDKINFYLVHMLITLIFYNEKFTLGQISALNISNSSNRIHLQPLYPTYSIPNEGL